MRIERNSVVEIDYTLTNDGGEILDTSDGVNPLAYLHGLGNIIPGLEKALDGKQAGESLTVVIQPAEAYGVRDESLVASVPKKLFENGQTIEPGMQFRATGPNGVQVLTVTALEGDNVTVDGNHPLAGVTLTFAVRVVSVRAATAEELSHGHVHGPGGHHHH